jgi:hypothetical protein
MWRWGSGCEVTLIGPDQTQQTVLRVDTTDKRDDPSIIDGHLYACYVLGPWEQLLRVKKLTGVIEQRRKIAAAARVLQERGQQLTGKNTPVSSSDASSARANWGIE